MTVPKWNNPLTEARPPARPQRIDWACVAAWVLPVVAFWGGIALLAYAKGWV